MNKLELLKKAIELRKPISFKYNKEGKVEGERIGNVHAIFIFTKKSGEQDTKVHIVQTGGVSDTEPNNFPDFRMFNISELSNVIILENENEFSINEKYNPEWKGYENIIAKI
ncbi:hypothetical protein IPJ72_06090 [Candidatus Peregrinibacteria bacterium]|nr:MAG: hypothetical protein IPJ72_06090 [Candidatus Peregrinibacteria bacterium]